MITSDSIEKCSRIIARVAIVEGKTPFNPGFDLVIDSSHSIYGSSQSIHLRTSFIPYQGNSGRSSGTEGTAAPLHALKNETIFFCFEFLLTISPPPRSRFATGQIIIKYEGLQSRDYTFVQSSSLQLRDMLAYSEMKFSSRSKKCIRPKVLLNNSVLLLLITYIML